MLVVAAACTASEESGSAELFKGHLTGVPIESAIGDIDSENAGVIRIALERVPEPLPPKAVSLVKFLVAAMTSPVGLTVATPPDGVLRSEFVVAAPGSNSIRVGLLCLRNVEQVPCAPTAAVWDIKLPPYTLAPATVEVPANEGDRLDFIVLVAGDATRPEPASTALSVTVGSGVQTNEAVSASPSHSAVFGGCGFATITADTSPQKTFRVPGTQPLERQLFLVVQPCPASARFEVVRAVQIVDELTALSLPGLESFTRVTPPALVIPLPRVSRVRSGSDVRIVVFRDGSPAWITHPVRFA
jgi:hypothetical protein